MDKDKHWLTGYLHICILNIKYLLLDDIHITLKQFNFTKINNILKFVSGLQFNYSLFNIFIVTIN